MMYIFNAERICFPFILVLYLTRVLSVECYSIYVYSYAIASYHRLIVDFGFDYSATRNVAKSTHAEDKLNIVFEVIMSKVFLWFCGVLSIFMYTILSNDMYIRQNLLFFFFISLEIFFEIFFLDFYFRGIEKMEIISYRYFISKIISLILIVLYIENDKYFLYISIFNCLGSFVGACVTFSSLDIPVKYNKSKLFNKKTIINQIKDSIKFFLTKITVSLFTFSNTVFLGRFSSAYDVAVWSLAVNIVSAIQSMYNPISNALFPAMSKKFDIKIIKKSIVFNIVIVIFTNIVFWFLDPVMIPFLFGERYECVSSILNILLIMLFFSAIINIMGWPVLGALGGERFMLLSTIMGALFHLSGIAILSYFGKLNAYTLSYWRVCSECVLSFFIIIFALKIMRIFNEVDRSC